MKHVELPDDRTTEDGESSPRSVATDKEIPQTITRICWADLGDSDSDEDTFKEVGDSSPRSVATDEQSVIPQTIKRTCWADLQDSGSDEHTCKDGKSAKNKRTNWAELQDSDDDQELALQESSEKWKSDSQAWQGNEKSSVQAINPDAQVVEIRINRSDGKPYTKEEFLSWFGKKFGLKRWNASEQASPALGNTEESRCSYSAKSGRQSDKHQCQILVGIEEDQKFHVVRRVLGTGGENMKDIANGSGAKLRLRGRGSKFLEGPEQQESTDALMLCISALDKKGYEKAKTAASDLIEGIHQHYREYCKNHGITCPQLCIDIHEGYRRGSR
jgi:hypothetical protein